MTHKSPKTKKNRKFGYQYGNDRFYRIVRMYRERPKKEVEAVMEPVCTGEISLAEAERRLGTDRAKPTPMRTFCQLDSNDRIRFMCDCVLNLTADERDKLLHMLHWMFEGAGADELEKHEGISFERFRRQKGIPPQAAPGSFSDLEDLIAKTGCIAEVARRLGVADRTVRRWRTGSRPDDDVLDRVKALARED